MNENNSFLHEFEKIVDRLFDNMNTNQESDLSSRYPLYYSIFGDLHNNLANPNQRTQIVQSKPPSQPQPPQHQEPELELEPEPEQIQYQNNNYASRKPEPGGFSFQPIGIENNSLSYEPGFTYSLAPCEEYFHFFNKIRDANATVRIPDNDEGFKYSFKEQFGEVEPVVKNYLRPKRKHPNEEQNRGGRGNRGGKGNRGGGNQNRGGGNQNRGGGNQNRGGGNQNRGGGKGNKGGGNQNRGGGNQMRGSPF